MNKTEEYLDSLLNNVSPEKKADSDRKRRRTSADFMKDFEKELDDTDIEDAILEFENEAGHPENLNNTEDSFFDNLEGIVNTAKEASAAKQEEDAQDSKEDAFEVNTLEDDSWTGAPEHEEETSSKTDSGSEEAQELLDVLSETPSKEEISDAAATGVQVQEDDGDGTEDLSSDQPSKKSGKKSKKKGKQSFVQKLATILFGEDEDEMPQEDAASESGSSNPSSEEDAAEEGGKASKKKNKDKKKKEKKPKEKKPKEKKEKKPKEKKPKKEKPPKKPKEVDLSPPLPKAPVILIFIMSFSVMVFVILASNLVGYSVNISAAKKAYAGNDYIEAYRQIAGLEPKEQDVYFGEQVALLAIVQSELVNGTDLYNLGEYTKALDSYICALGRYDANYEDAVNYQIQLKYDALAELIIAQMEEQFGVSAETAREIYNLNDRGEYTRRIYTIVKNLGLTE